MPELNHLTRSAPFSVDVDVGDGDVVNVVYDRNRITPAWMRDSAILDDQNDPLALSKMLGSVIVSWDVTNDGEPFPPSADNIAVLSYPAQQALLGRILTAAVPSESEGKASSEALFLQPPTFTEASPRSPNGAQTSQLPNVSASPSPT